MKIAFVLDDSLDKPDGVQQYVLTLGSWLSSQGHNVHYLAGETVRTDVSNIHSLATNLGVRFNKNRLSIPLPASLHRIAAVLDREQFDVIHVQMPYSPFLAARIIKHAAPTTAVIGTFHILPYSGLQKVASHLLRLMTRKTLKRFDKVVSVSAPAASFAKHTFGLDSDVVPNAVDLTRFENAAPLKKYDGDTPTIIFLGRLVERKGALEFLKMLERLLAEKSPTFRVVMCGSGPLEKDLKRYCAKNKLDNLVEFAGFVLEEDKPSYLASADIAVFPSLGGESFGIVLIEAMAAGAKVVIAGDNPGYATVMSGAEGHLVDPRDSDGFAATIAGYLKDSHAREESLAWQAKHVKQYDVAVVGATLTKLYQDAVAKLRRQPDNTKGSV